jgi:transcriptional regulator with XRE-family HTH domain
MPVFVPSMGVMIMHGNANVLPLFDRPREKSYRAAVSKVIRDLKSREGLSNTELGEEIGCCAETIGNAENENNNLSALILLNIAFRYGEDAIAPVRELYLCRHAEPKTINERFDDLHKQIDALRSAAGAA